nr:replication associated protein [Flumine genomovirus 6]
MGYNISLPRTSKNTFLITCLLQSTAAMSSSPTLNAESLMVSSLWTTFRRWEASVSWQEKVTRMGDFTYTCFAISDGSFEVEKLMYSMWQVSTQTLNLLEEHQRRDSIIRSRMETSSVEDSVVQRGRAEEEMGRLYLAGLRSRVQAVETSFGNWCTAWIPRVQLALSRRSPSTPTGNLLLTLPVMSHHWELNSLAETWTEEMTGYHNLVWEVENHS